MSERHLKSALALLIFAMLVIVGSMFSSVGQPHMAQSDITKLADQLSNRLSLTYKDMRAQCTSIDRVPSCKEFNEAYAILAMRIFRAKFDDTGASLKHLQREFDKRPDIIQ